MYHDVRPTPEGFPFFQYLHREDFGRQLDHFLATDRFVSREEFLGALAGDSPASDGVILTFDDGFADHYRHALPELQARGLWGIFYVCTAPYETGRVLDVHRIHLLLGAHGGVRVLDELETLLEPRMLSHEHVREFTTATYSTQTNDAATTRVKRILNYFVSYEFREFLLDELMRRLLGDETLLARELYMSSEELRAMRDSGMLVGSHSVTHPVFSKLPVDAQGREIRDSFSVLESMIGSGQPRTFCYPYGGFHSFTADTERLLTEAGCRFAFNVEPRDIAATDLGNRPQALPRFDCNQFPFGRVRGPVG